MIEDGDPFDPRYWAEPVYQTITLSTDGSIFTIIDVDHYDWLMSQGPWSLYEWGGKRYARRARRKGERGHGATVYMHRMIAFKYLPEPPTKYHFIVDHRNGNGLDNRTKIGLRKRSNLVWATSQNNRCNLWGASWHQASWLDDYWERQKAV